MREFSTIHPGVVLVKPAWSQKRPFVKQASMSLWRSNISDVCQTFVG
jgi:hypothetical protein